MLELTFYLLPIDLSPLLEPWPQPFGFEGRIPYVDRNIVLTGLFIAPRTQSRGIKGACKQINPDIELE